ncbi:MAG: hypothetical protein C0436_02890 [Alphaproteobacteria bacterium]|nr:hypothetical protein [Alphaproteobacteria bacterium]
MSEPIRPSFFQRLDNFVRGVANGATFGLADKFAGTMNSIGSDKTMSEHIATEHARSVHARKTDAAYFAGEATGALGTGAALFNAASKQVAAAASSEALAQGAASMAGITLYTGTASVSAIERTSELHAPLTPNMPASSSPTR